jgi:hypothetical protein
MKPLCQGLPDIRRGRTAAAFAGLLMGLSAAGVAKADMIPPASMPLSAMVTLQQGGMTSRNAQVPPAASLPGVAQVPDLPGNLQMGQMTQLAQSLTAVQQTIQAVLQPPATPAASATGPTTLAAPSSSSRDSERFGSRAPAATNHRVVQADVIPYPQHLQAQARPQQPRAAQEPPAIPYPRAQDSNFAAPATSPATSAAGVASSYGRDGARFDSSVRTATNPREVQAGAIPYPQHLQAQTRPQQASSAQTAPTIPYPGAAR